MTDHSLAPNFVESFDRLNLNQLSKSSPSRLPPFQLKRSRSQQGPVPPLPIVTSINDPSYSVSTAGTTTSTAAITSPPASKYPNQASHHNNNNNNSNNKPSNLSHVPCKFFKQGTCTAGANCIFSHNPDPTCESAVCKYFLKGNCKFGSKCALLHTMSPYTSDGRKLLASQQHHRDRNLNSNNSPSTSSMASAMAAAAAAATAMNGNDGGLALSLGSSSGLQNLRSPPLGSPLDFGPHMYSPARGSFFDQTLSTSADARSYSHLTAAIHRQQDTSSLHDPRRKLSTTSSNGYESLYSSSNNNNSGVRAASSPGTADLSSSPFGQRSLFLHPNNTPSSAVSMPPPSSSLLSRHAQALHSIPESASHFLDVPPQQQQHYFDDDHEDLNDAMLPSSLNELLTPTELQLRRAREQQHQQSLNNRNNYQPGSGLERSPSESMRYKTASPLAAKSLDMGYATYDTSSPWQQAFNKNNNNNDDLYDDQLLQQQGGASAINIPGGSKPVKPLSSASLINNHHHHHHQDEYRINNNKDNDLFSPFAGADDEGPFYMEDTESMVNGGGSSNAGTIGAENGRQSNNLSSATATTSTDDRHRLLTPFEFPSLKS